MPEVEGGAEGRRELPAGAGGGTGARPSGENRRGPSRNSGFKGHWERKKRTAGQARPHHAKPGLAS